MAKVSNLKIQLQSGSGNTHFASWEFNENTKTTTTTTGAIKAGSLVTIKSSAKTWYNGVSIPSWVKSDKWYVVQVKGSRAVLGKNQSGTHNIQSPINVANLQGGSSSSSTTTIKTLDYYQVSWAYDTGDGVWFDGGSSNVTVKNATYSAPENAIRIKVTVKPVSKTHKVNGKDTSYWSGTSTSYTYSVTVNPPDVPPAPTVEIDKYKLTVKVENVSDSKTDQIQFEIYNGVKLINTTSINVVTCMASYSLTVPAGGEYRVRARAVNIYGSSKNYSEWTSFSASVTTIPNPPSGITVCRAASSTSVYLEWTAVSGATSYDIEYTTEQRYFDSSDQTTVVSGIENNYYEKTGLASGDEYFFRVRAVNDQGSSEWSGVKSVIIGKKPSAPTTWSSTTTAITGEPLTLYWVHNSEDNSKMKYAELELYIGDQKETHTIEGNNTDDESEEKTYSYFIDTSKYQEGTKILWRVRTSGITNQYGDWSIQRSIDIYAPPTLELTLTDLEGTQIQVLESFPFKINGLAGPKTQAPIGYHVSIIANESYETVDSIGNPKLINQGDEVYSKYLDITDPLELTITASDIDLENNIGYSVICIVSMNSGLTAEASISLEVSWTDVEYEPDVEISYDEDILATFIKPYCSDEDGYLIEDILLSVYRREFDGSYTEIAKDLENVDNIVVTDPHPALDYARYRIVAITKSTGAVSYYDAPAYPLNEHCVVIQWDEEWSTFYVTNEDEMESPPWAGSLLKLKYNIDVSDSNDPDVSLVKYAGRKNPVSYYGTQIGSTATWSMEIPKTDVDTLYALRRLSVWMGDVYVREPSGSGYWANVTVSFDKKHDSLVIPITLSISRVEGGA